MVVWNERESRLRMLRSLHHILDRAQASRYHYPLWWRMIRTMYVHGNSVFIGNSAQLRHVAYMSEHQTHASPLKHMPDRSSITGLTEPWGGGAAAASSPLKPRSWLPNFLTAYMTSLRLLAGRHWFLAVMVYLFFTTALLLGYFHD